MPFQLKSKPHAPPPEMLGIIRCRRRRRGFDMVTKKNAMILVHIYFVRACRDMTRFKQLDFLAGRPATPRGFARCHAAAKMRRAKEGWVFTFDDATERFIAAFGKDFGLTFVDALADISAFLAKRALGRERPLGSFYISRRLLSPT